MSDCGHNNAERNVCAGCHALLRVEIKRLRVLALNWEAEARECHRLIVEQAAHVERLRAGEK